MDYALSRLKASILLRICAVTAFMAYGGLLALVLAGKLSFGHAGVVALLSLASWFFLFWWYPIMERTIQALGDDPRRRAVGGILEWIAIACIVVVHFLLALIVVHSAARS
jgi:hypothetical protein